MQISPSENFSTLLNLVDTTIPEPTRFKLLAMFESLKDDRESPNGKTYMGLMNAPASAAAHHDYKGGLVKHYLEMYGFARQLNSSFGFAEKDVLLAIIAHDIHKASYNYEYTDAEKTKFTYSSHPVYDLLTKNQRSFMLFAEHGIVLDLYQANALFSSEGGYNKEAPKMNTPFSKFIYLLDELSANVLNRIEQQRLLHYKTSISIKGNTASNPDNL